MTPGGMYDFAGEWELRVGLPAKSGVGGGIMAVLQGQLGIGVFSPRLDEHGNSTRGIRVCEELTERLHLHLLAHRGRVLDAFPFLRRFHDIVISGDLKILKPDPRIYAALIERRRFDPARAFFIDDNERNVAAARRLGMRAHHYRGPAALFADCRALGLPVPDIA